jgi:hypothetical protein
VSKDIEPYTWVRAKHPIFHVWENAYYTEKRGDKYLVFFDGDGPERLVTDISALDDFHTEAVEAGLITGQD